MIWGTIWIGGRSNIVFMERDEKAPRRGYSAWSYLQVLTDQAQRIFQPGMRFQQDNAGIPTARVVREWFESEGLEVEDWPPYSPDLNPIEHLWRMLKDRINQNYPHLKTMGKGKQAYEALYRAIVTEWDAIDQEEIDNLIRSMDNRVNHVLAAKGWHTWY